MFFRLGTGNLHGVHNDLTHTYITTYIVYSPEHSCGDCVQCMYTSVIFTVNVKYVHYYTCEKFMQICQNRPLKKYMYTQFLHLRFSISSIALYCIAWPGKN